MENHLSEQLNYAPVAVVIHISRQQKRTPKRHDSFGCNTKTMERGMRKPDTKEK